MNTDLATLCVIPNDFQVQPNWSSIGCEDGQPRKVQACLTNVYTYENNRPEPIKDWDAFKTNYGINVATMLTFSDLTDLLSDLVTQQEAMYIYNGMIPLSCKRRRPDSTYSNFGKFRYKFCMEYPGAEYAGAYSSTLADLWGFDPDIAYGEPFMLGWFASDDPVLAAILQRYSQWPDNQCRSMLPAGPSPSTSSIEFTGLGREEGVIGLFMPDGEETLSPDRLRALLGDSAILAAIDSPRMMRWLDGYIDLDDLLPVDRPLPFQV